MTTVDVIETIESYSNEFGQEVNKPQTIDGLVSSEYPKIIQEVIEFVSDIENGRWLSNYWSNYGSNYGSLWRKTPDVIEFVSDEIEVVDFTPETIEIGTQTETHSIGTQTESIEKPYRVKEFLFTLLKFINPIRCRFVETTTKDLGSAPADVENDVDVQ